MRFFSPPPQEYPLDPAERLGRDLADLLIRIHRIPAEAHSIGPGQVAVRVYFRLIARTDGHLIWWTVPDDGRRTRPLRIYATTPATAASRLADHYTQLKQRPIAEIVAGLPLLTNLLLRQNTDTRR